MLSYAIELTAICRAVQNNRYERNYSAFYYVCMKDRIEVIIDYVKTISLMQCISAETTT